MEGIFLVFICFITVLICVMFVYVINKIEKGITITIEEKAREYEPIEDPFDKEGDVKDKELEGQVSMDEVLKDADVIHHCMNDPAKPVKEKEQSRYDRLCVEFGL